MPRVRVMRARSTAPCYGRSRVPADQRGIRTVGWDSCNSPTARDAPPLSIETRCSIASGHPVLPGDVRRRATFRAWFAGALTHFSASDAAMRPRMRARALAMVAGGCRTGLLDCRHAVPRVQATDDAPVHLVCVRLLRWARGDRVAARVRRVPRR